MPQSSKRSRSGVLRADSFDAIAKAETPFAWPIAHFYDKITSLNSGLDAFTSGDVRDIVCYKNGAYKYLLMCVHTQNEGAPLVWVRTERHPVKRSNISRSPAVTDTIRFSYDPSKLWKPEDDRVMASALTTLNFRHVVDLLNIVHNIPNTYIMTDSNWYAGVLIGMLHGGFGESWVNPPPPNWVKMAPYIFGSYAPGAMQHVERQFAIRHPNMKRISLREPEAWKNELTPLSQPPSSKQDDREGADSNPASTREKVAHVSSAPTLLQEHPQEPRPMQSPNPNGAAPVETTDAKNNGGDQPRGREIRDGPAPGIGHSTGLVSKPLKSLTSYDPHRPSISQSRDPISGQTDETRPVQPPSASPTPTSPTRMSTKEGSTGIDEITPTLQGAVITAPSPEAFGRGPQEGPGHESSPQASPSFTNAQPSSPGETPNLTDRIVRLNPTPMAIGGYSSVYRGSLCSPTSDDPDRVLPVAIKVLRARISNMDEHMLRQKLHKRLHVEMRIWAQLHHENVVRLLGHTEEPEGPGLVSMLYCHGNVLSFLVKNPDVNREIICADVALGLQYLHDHEAQIIHGDLNGENVVIDAEGRASICDFGLSIILDGEPTGHTSSDFGGSLRFMAPELQEESTRTVQTDIYAYACTCFQILFDQKPYHKLTQHAHIVCAILNCQPPFEPSDKGVTFPSLLQVLKCCLDHDRWSRPSVKLIIDTIQHCLYDSFEANLGIHQGTERQPSTRTFSASSAPVEKSGVVLSDPTDPERTNAVMLKSPEPEDDPASASVSFGLLSHPEGQGSSYSPLAQPNYAPRVENSEVPLQRGPSELPPPALRMHHHTSWTSSGSSRVGAPHDADESASGQSPSPRLSVIVSPVRGLTSSHSPAPPSTVPRSEVPGGVMRFAVGFTPQPQYEVENPRAPVANSFRAVISTTPALELSEARTQKEMDIPSRPSNSSSSSTRIARADNNTITLKDVPLVSSLGTKTQSPGTLLSQTPHPLADAFPPGVRSLFQDEANDAPETKEMPALNDLPSSMSLTVLSSPVISSSITLDKVVPTLPEKVLPEITRGDDAEPDTIAAVKGPDDSLEDLTSTHALTSLISIGLPAPSENSVRLVVSGAFDVKEDSDHPVIVPSDKTNYATLPLASDDITSKDIPSLPLASAPPPSTFSAIEIQVDAEIAVRPSPIVEGGVSVQPAAELLTVVTERDVGSSSIPFVHTPFEDAPHGVKISTVSTSCACTPLEAGLPSEPVEPSRIDVSGRTEPGVNLHPIELSELGPTTPHDTKLLTSASHPRSTAIGEPRDLDTDYPTSEEYVPGPSPRPISDMLAAPLATTSVEEANAATSRPSALEADLQPTASGRLVLDSPALWDAPVAGVASTPAPSASVEQSRAITSVPPDPEDNRAFLASERPVLDGSANWDALVADVAKTLPPSARVDQPGAVTPGPEDNLALPISKRPVLDTSIDWEAPVINVLKAPLSSASDEQPGVITTGPPEPGDTLAPVASEIPVLDSLIDWEAPVIYVPEPPVPSASVEQPRAITTKGPEPEDDPASITSERPILDSLIYLGSLIDVTEAPIMPSAPVEQPRAVATKGPESEDDPAPAASERPVPDILIDWEILDINVAKATIPNASIERANAVMLESLEPEDDPASVVSERPVSDTATPWDTPVTEVPETLPLSASHKQPVTLGPSELEGDLSAGASEGPILGSLIDWEAPVIDATNAPPSRASDEQPSAVTLGSPASERPVLDTPAYWNTDVTDVAEAPQLSASNAPVEKSGIVLSDPPGPEDVLDDTAPDRPVSKALYPSDPQVTDEIDALASSVCSGDDTVTMAYPPSAVGDSIQADTKDQVHRKTKTRSAPGIDRFNAFASRALESLTSYDPHRPPISPTGSPLSGQIDASPPAQPTNPFPASTPSTRTSPKGISIGIDEATSILPDIVITASSTEALEQGPDTSPSFANPQPSPPEIPDLTGRIDRLGLTPIATGGYSSVWRGRLLSATSDDTDRALQVAIKVLRVLYTDEHTATRKLHKRLHVEMRIWAKLRHENVVRLLGHTEEPEGPGLVSMLYPHGSVLSFLAKNPSVNREIICADVVLGLQYLHEHDPPIIHGDLKGPNVLIDAEGRASICDFGLSIILDGGPTGRTTSNFGGSLRFLAPELLGESARTVQTDIYAYACTCIQILFDQKPYHQLSKEAYIVRAILHHPPFEPSNEEVTFPPFLGILKRSWDHDRWSRPPLKLIIDTLQRCLYRTYRANLGIHQGIGKRVRFMGLPGIEPGNLVALADGGLSIFVDSSPFLCRVPIYQRYRWELMDGQDLGDSEDGSDVSWSPEADHQYSPFAASSSLSGKFTSSESSPYVSKWNDYSAKFRLPYSSMVSYESYHKA